MFKTDWWLLAVSDILCSHVLSLQRSHCIERAKEMTRYAFFPSLSISNHACRFSKYALQSCIQQCSSVNGLYES